MRRAESAVGILTKDTDARMPGGAAQCEKMPSRQGLPAGAGKAAAKGAEHLQRDGSGAGETGAGQFRNGNGNKYAQWVPPTLQPLPLASRYVDTAKQDSLHPSSSSALGSAWIRRFLPSVPNADDGEMGTETPGFFMEGRASGGGHSPNAPMLLPPGHNNPKLQEVGVEGQWTGAGNGPIPNRNDHYAQKGKGLMESDQRPEIPAAVQNVVKDGIGSSVQKGTTVPCQTKVYVAEGSGRQHQHQHQQPHDGERGTDVPPTRLEPQMNGKIAPMVAGFGSLRVGVNAPVKDFRKVGTTPKVANARDQSLTFPPRGDFRDKNHLEEEAGDYKGMADPIKSVKKAKLGAPTDDQDGLHGQNGKTISPVLSTPLIPAFKRRNRVEASYATLLTAAPPPDAIRRLHYQSEPADRPSGIPMAEGIQEEKEEAKLVPFPREVLHLLGTPSSHFSSSPWPNNDEIQYPHDDGYLYPHNSQGACGSGFQSQGSRIPKRTGSDSRGQHTSTHRKETGSSREGSDAQKRPRELSFSVLDPGESAGSQRKVARRQDTENGKSKVHEATNPSQHFARQYMREEQRDNGSISCGPSHPYGVTDNGDWRSRGVPPDATDKWLSRVGHVSVESAAEQEDCWVPRRQNLPGTVSVGSYSRKQRECELAGHGARASDAGGRDSSGNEADKRNAQPNVEHMYRETGRCDRSEQGDFGQEPGIQRTSGEDLGEADLSGPSNRSSHPCHVNSKDSSSRKRVANTSSLEQENGRNKRMSSSWLQRWLPSSNGTSAKPPTPFARPKDRPVGGLNGKIIQGSGGKNPPQPKKVEPASRPRIQEWNVSMSRNGVKDVSSKRGMNETQSCPIPSAAAMALASTAARKIGPFPQQRKGSVNMWPSVQFQSLQTPDGQESQ